MGTDDKVDNKVEELTGSAKKKYGEATDNEEMAAEGRGQETKGNVKQAGEKVKDVFKS